MIQISCKLLQNGSIHINFENELNKLYQVVKKR